MSLKIKRRFLHLVNKMPQLHGHPPLISEDFIEALIRNTDYFQADISKCIDPYGNSYSNGWQYFTSMVKNMDRYPEEEIISDFVRYIEITKHGTAFDGFRLKFNGSEGLKEFPPACLAYLTPWSPSDITRVKTSVNDILRHERLHTGEDVSGLNPLKEPRYLAENHFLRLHELRDSIRAKGYNWLKNINDPVQTFVLTRDQDYRILIFSGQHRVAVLSGLNHLRVPVRFVNKYIINESGVNEWPLVRQGIWNREDALLYYHHLFDYDSSAWADECKLLM